MAKTCIHILGARTASCDAHNFREKSNGERVEYDYLLPLEHRGQNEHWSIQSSRSRESEIRAKYQNSVGQKMQEKAKPIREGVVVIEENTSMEMLHKLANRYKKAFGITCFQIHIHRDEGYIRKEKMVSETDELNRPKRADSSDEPAEVKKNLHAHMVFDWTDETTGKAVRLNKKQMMEMQTITAEVLGMERGVAKSETKAKHIRPEEWRAASDELHTLTEQVSIKKKELLKLKDTESHLWTPSKSQAQQLLTIGEALLGNEKSLKQLTILNEQSRMKTITIEELRNIPLVDVLRSCEAVRDSSDHCNWKTADGGRISLEKKEQYQWYDHNKNKGGAGAIDLYCHLKNCSFRQAIEELPRLPKQSQNRSHFFSVVEEKQVPAEPIPAPSADVLKNKIMVEYLTNIRKISPEILKPLLAAGTVFADAHANCCFLSHNKKGCEIRGTGGDKFKGYRGEKSAFLLLGKEKKIAYVESAIDAMSLQQLGFTGSIISFGGQAINRVIANAKKAKEQGWSIIAAFDNDPAGQAMGAKLKEVIPDTTIGIPKKGAKDWNDHLISLLSHAKEKKAQEHVQEPNVSKTASKVPEKSNGQGFGMGR